MISIRPFVSGLLAGSPFLLTVCASASGVEVDPLAGPANSSASASATAPPAQDPGVEPHGGMLRYPDVSATHIAFVYADDLWLVPREVAPCPSPKRIWLVLKPRPALPSSPASILWPCAVAEVGFQATPGVLPRS